MSGHLTNFIFVITAEILHHGYGTQYQRTAERQLSGGEGDLQLTEQELINLSTRELNKLCCYIPKDAMKQLKERRQTLKNRSYAYQSRLRKVSGKKQLEIKCSEMKKQILQQKQQILELQEALDAMKRKESCTSSAFVSGAICDPSPHHPRDQV